MPGSFASEVRSRSRFADRVREEVGITVIRPDPRRLRAEELAAWAEARVGHFPETLTRELLYSELLLLQKEYVRLLGRCKPSQRSALQRAHESAYERLEALLDDIAPPQTTKPPRPKPPPPSPAPPAGIDIGDPDTW